MTSDELLESADHLFRSIVIIGGGVIGVEFATFYNDLGCEVTIVEGLDRLLPNLDRELGQSLAQLLKKRGVKIHTGAMVQSVTEGGGEGRGNPRQGGKIRHVRQRRTVIEGADRSFMKVAAHADDHRIVGAQLMCGRSTDMISQISMAIANGLTAEQLLRAMRPHPTFEEGLMECLEDLLNKLQK